MNVDQPRRPAGTPAGGQWAPAAHSEPEVELAPVSHSERQFRVLYTVRSGINDKRYRANETTVSAVTPEDAANKAVEWAHDNDPYCDERAQPLVEVLRTTEVGNEQYCYECGGPCFVDENGVAYHVSEDGDIDYDTNADHVAIPEPEP